MSLEAEALVDRRRLSRRLSFWRFTTILAILIAIISAASLSNNSPILKKQHIARVQIDGVITDNRDQQKLLEKIAKSKDVKAVLLHINSPGGTTTGGEALFEQIRKVAKNKPVVAVFGTIATSAAYIAGLGTDYIVARGNTITGSVGVIFQWAEVSKLLENVGIKMEEIKSGPLKASPSPFKPADEAGRQLAQEMVSESHQWFLKLVKDRRKLEPSSVPGLVDGRIYSGRQALTHKLIDKVGGETEALVWLRSKHKVSSTLEIKDWKVQEIETYGLFSYFGMKLAEKLGVPTNIFNKNVGLELLRLDGLVSVWHPR